MKPERGRSISLCSMEHARYVLTEMLFQEKMVSYLLCMAKIEEKEEKELSCPKFVHFDFRSFFFILFLSIFINGRKNMYVMYVQDRK